MGSAEAFLEYLRFSKQDSDKFWEQIASEFEWIRRWDTVQKGTLPEFEFFSGGVMNPCVNLLDRHVASGSGNRVALIWESETGESSFRTYSMLLDDVQRCSNMLKSLGVGHGSAVAIFLSQCSRVRRRYSCLFPNRSDLQHRLLRFFRPRLEMIASSHSARRWSLRQITVFAAANGSP